MTSIHIPGFLTVAASDHHSQASPRSCKFRSNDEDAKKISGAIFLYNSIKCIKFIIDEFFTLPIGLQ